MLEAQVNITITFNTDSAPFEVDFRGEVHWLLRRVAQKLEDLLQHPDDSPLTLSNSDGSPIGQIEVTK
jgi:hypothetical protein